MSANTANRLVNPGQTPSTHMHQIVGGVRIFLLSFLGNTWIFILSQWLTLRADDPQNNRTHSNPPCP